MIEIVGGVATSHVPSIGATVDHGKTGEPYWEPLFRGYERARQWMAEAKPDVVLIVYNDHACAFSIDLVPTFLLGVADEFQPADEGYGRRQVPVVDGHPELAWHLYESLVLDEFDMTLCHSMTVDHGLTVPLSIMCGEPDAWPCKVIPLCVNVIQYPPPTGAASSSAKRYDERSIAMIRICARPSSAPAVCRISFRERGPDSSMKNSMRHFWTN